MEVKSKNKRRIPKPEVALKEYWDDNDRFADLFNTCLFGGHKLINPENLKECDTDESAIIDYKNGMIESVKRHRDIAKSYNKGLDLVIIGIENQQKVHYGMPVRNMVYDSLNYTKQCKGFVKETKSKSSNAEFLSGMKKGNKINPVISLVIYYGECDDWDGPLSLSEMTNIPAEIKPYFNDYKINLISIKDTDNFSFEYEDNKKFFEISKYLYKAGKKINLVELNDKFPDLQLNQETLLAIGAATGSSSFMKLAMENKEEEINMCEAIKTLMEQGKTEGKAEGKAEVAKKLLNLNMPIEQIVEVTGLTKEEIEKL